MRRFLGLSDEAAEGGGNVTAAADEIVEGVGRLPPRPAGRAPWQSTQTGITTSNARRLRNNLGSEIADNEQAHHIVASTHGRAQPARELLDHFEIDINGAAKGVGLPRPVHEGTGLHTHTGIDLVTRRLRQAIRGIDDWNRARGALVEELQRMGNQIKTGLFEP